MASRPSKYAHVVDGLKKLDAIEPERKAIVTAVMDEITTQAEPVLTGGEILDALSVANHNVKLLIRHLKLATGGSRYAAKLGDAYADARVFMDDVQGWKSSLQVVIDAYELLMLEQMEVEGVASMRLESGASVSTTIEPYGQVKDKEAFRLWCAAPADKCMDCGEREDAPWHSEEASEDLQVHRYHPGGGYEKQLQLWPSSMNAIVKERTLEGVAPPDGVEVFAKTMVRLNKA